MYSTAGRQQQAAGGGGGHAGADQVSLCSSSYFNWTPVYSDIELTTCILFDLCKIRLVSNLPEGNYCVRCLHEF
jgi:hypothetical protein